MALFSTLAGSTKSEATTTGTTSSKSLDLPTVVQLFVENPFPLIIDTAAQHALGNSTTSGNVVVTPTLPPSFAALHYTAVQCQTAAQLKELSTEQQRGLRQAKKVVHVATPDLGVWNYHVLPTTNRYSTSTSAANTSSGSNVTTTQSTAPPVASATDLLSVVAKSSKASTFRTFCMAVDLSNIENVEPSITRIQEALVRFLISTQDSTSSAEKADPTGPTSTESVMTTSLYQLRTVQFGLGPHDTKSAEAMTKTEPDPADKDIVIALQICVQLPENESDFQEYRDQQAVSLIVYHLRRYAAALSASLLFVSGVPTRGSSSGGSSNAKKDPAAELGLSPSKSADLQEARSFVLLKEQPAVPVQQLPIIWRELALGKPVWKPETVPDIYEDLNIPINQPTDDTERTPTDDDDTAGKANTESAHSLIYGPGAHNEELIETVLLRNANYPGHWDAAKESVWKILPKEDENDTSATTQQSSKKKGGAGNQPVRTGDDWWLSELRESIAIPDAMKTPPPKKSAESASSVAKTPNDAAVSSFFEDLLK